MKETLPEGSESLFLCDPICDLSSSLGGSRGYFGTLLLSGPLLILIVDDSRRVLRVLEVLLVLLLLRGLIVYSFDSVSFIGRVPL